MKPMRTFLKYYKPYIGIIALDLFCAALTTVCELVFPKLISFITDTAAQTPHLLMMSTVFKIGGIYLFLRLIDTVANYYMANRGHIMGARLEADMRRDLFNHLQKLPFSYYDNTKVGQIMSRLTHDLFDVTEFAHHCPEEIFISSIKIIGSFIILANVNIWLTLIIFMLLPLMLISTLLFRKKMKRAFKLQRQEIGELNAGIEDNLLGIRVVKSFANEDVEREKFEKGNQKFLDTKKYAYKYMALFQSGTRFSDGVLYIGIIVIGSLFLIKKHITPGDLVAYLLYIQTLIASIRTIVQFTEQFQKGMTGIERFVEIMNEPVRIENLPNAADAENINGEITLDNVSFRYSTDTEDVLSHINLKIKQGENIAIVGPSGGGKTTLCNLIPRFYEIDEGQILLDGKNIKELTLSSLRNNIGIVQQDVYLFSGSVRENITYGKVNATDEEIIASAQLAGAHDFIMALPNGYDTYVGERGVKLSGGQKQRISIARLFLKNPPVLILDEATSALDNESEHIVQKSLEKLSQGRTTLTIAHRLTTIKNADRIVVLGSEGILEEGTHQELIDKNGEYAKLYKLYT